MSKIRSGILAKVEIDLYDDIKNHNKGGMMYDLYMDSIKNALFKEINMDVFREESDDKVIYFCRAWEIEDM